MWQKVLGKAFIWIGKQIALALANEAARRLAEKRKQALAAEAEALRQAQLASAAHKEASELEGAASPFDVFADKA